MNLIFIGTAEFGLPALEEVASNHTISLVVTQPDRPAGREGNLRPPPVKKTAEQLELNLYQPENINSDRSIQKIEAIDPDGLVVVAYGQIISGDILNLVDWPINIHGSLLPSYRGAAPINWAVINGERHTGVTTMVMDEGMDTGPILLQRSIGIGKNETAGSVHDRLASVASDLIIETIEQLENDQLQPVPQPSEGSLAPKLSRDEGEVDWSKPSQRVHNKIRGMNPWPGAFAFYEGSRIKLHESRNCGKATSLPYDQPGQIVDFASEAITVVCGDNTTLQLTELQPESRRPMSGAEFRNGYRVQKGDRFR